MALKNELSTEQFITAHVRCADKLGKHLEVRFLDADCAVRCLAVLQHEEVSEERLGAFEVCALPESSPKVESASNRLFCPIVEVVAERGADL